MVWGVTDVTRNTDLQLGKREKILDFLIYDLRIKLLGCIFFGLFLVYEGITNINEPLHMLSFIVGFLIVIWGTVNPK